MVSKVQYTLPTKYQILQKYTLQNLTIQFVQVKNSKTLQEITTFELYLQKVTSLYNFVKCEKKEIKLTGTEKDSNCWMFFQPLLMVL